MHFTHVHTIHKALAAYKDAGHISDDQHKLTVAAFNAEPVDISTADFYRTLNACHSRILQILKADSKRHQMNRDIGCWDSVVEEELMPVLERIIYWEPGDDEINAPLHA